MSSCHYQGPLSKGSIDHESSLLVIGVVKPLFWANVGMGMDRTLSGSCVHEGVLAGVFPNACVLTLALLSWVLMLQISMELYPVRRLSHVHEAVQLPTYSGGTTPHAMLHRCPKQSQVRKGALKVHESLRAANVTRSPTRRFRLPPSRAASVAS